MNWIQRLRERVSRPTCPQTSLSSRSRRTRLCIEPLEDRILLDTYYVRTVLDNGDNANPTIDSLRAAIKAANEHPNDPLFTPDRIEFRIGNGLQVIRPLNNKLPDITDPVTIDGTPPADMNTQVIQIAGTNVNVGSGLTVAEMGGGSTIRRLVITNFTSGSGIWLYGDGNTIVGCRIGTNPDGTGAQENLIGITLSGSQG